MNLWIILQHKEMILIERIKVENLTGMRSV